MNDKTVTYVAANIIPRSAPPRDETSLTARLRKNLFSTPTDAILTITLSLFAAWVLWGVLKWGVFSAVFTGEDRSVCVSQNGESIGACWPFVTSKLGQFMYGLYPEASRWRVDLTIALTVALATPFLIPSAPYKALNAGLLFIILPIVSLVLLTGGHIDLGDIWIAFLIGVAGVITALIASSRIATMTSALPLWLGVSALAALIVANVIPSATVRLLGTDFHILSLLSIGLALAGIAINILTALREGAEKALVVALPILLTLFLIIVLQMDFGLRSVPTHQWGGLSLTLVVAISGIAASMPLGILLALGRRSHLPAIRLVSIIFIEFWRGVPLITVLFMSAFMIPLLLPEGVTFNSLLRALIGVALFTAAYLAEVVRGGLQAIPKGQYEGAEALGVGYWPMMRLIIMPQALRLVIPGIMISFIAMFKDTSLVYIIGLADFLGTIRRGFADPNWMTASTAATGLVFAAFVYWLFCFGMSLYSNFMERWLETGHKR